MNRPRFRGQARYAGRCVSPWLWSCCAPATVCSCNCALLQVDGTALAQGQLNWALVNSYGMALRNKVMFNPSTLVSDTEWDKWTKPLTDCKIKVGQGG